MATVSHVLNGTRPVLPHTRQAVLDAVDELGYTPNTLARSLVTSRTRSIGLAVSAISNPYFTEILQGVEASALEHGYSLLIADPHDDPEHERKVVQLLHERRVDGMIVAPSADPRELVSYLGRHQVPTVFLDRVIDGVGGGAAGARTGVPVDAPVDGTQPFDQVCAENTEPMAGLVTHLAGLGHRRIGLVVSLPGLSTTAERITGYRQGLTSARLPYDDHLVVHGDSESAGAERATAALLALAAPPTALVTANNAMTIGTLRALRPARSLGTGRPRPVLLRRLRLGRPVLAPAHRDRPAQQGDRRPGGPSAPGTSRQPGPARPDRTPRLHVHAPHLVRLPGPRLAGAVLRVLPALRFLPALLSPRSPRSPRSSRKDLFRDRRRR